MVAMKAMKAMEAMKVMKAMKTMNAMNALNLGEYSTLEKCQTASRDIAVYVGNPTIDTPRADNDGKLVNSGKFCIRVPHENK